MFVNDLCGGPLPQHLPGGQRTALPLCGLQDQTQVTSLVWQAPLPESRLSSRIYLVLWDTVPYWTWTCLTVLTAAEICLHLPNTAVTDVHHHIGTSRGSGDVHSGCCGCAVSTSTHWALAKPHYFLLCTQNVWVNTENTSKLHKISKTLHLLCMDIKKKITW